MSLFILYSLLNLGCIFSPVVTEMPQNQNNFVQFYVIGMDDPMESRSIDENLRAKSGVLMSRTDPNTRICFVIFSNSQTYDESNFTAWLQQMDYEIACFRNGIHGVDPVYSKENYQCD